MRISDWSSTCALPICAADEDIADPQRAAPDEDGRHGAAALVELRLDHRAFGIAVGVGLELHDPGLHRDRVEQLVEVLLPECGHFDILDAAAHFPDDHLTLDTAPPHALRVTAVLVALVCHDNDMPARPLAIIELAKRMGVERTGGAADQEP